MYVFRNSKLREQAVEVLRDLLASHDSDIRYTSPETRSRIACIYLPLLSVVMDNYCRLYKVGVYVGYGLLLWVWFVSIGWRRVGQLGYYI